MSGANSLLAYYAQRAPEYEQIYARPERQADQSRLRARLCALLAAERVLEVACGTGYWTQDIARVATHVTATDAGEEVLALARAKAIDPRRVTFRKADAFALEMVPGTFTAALAAFWVSHVPRPDLARFLSGVHAGLVRGGRVVLCDNTFVPGSSTPESRRDQAGNAYQVRTLAAGTRHDVLKNYLTADELRAAAGDVERWEYETLGYYWLATYRLRR